MKATRQIFNQDILEWRKIDIFGKTTVTEIKSRYYDLEEPTTIFR